MDHKPVKICPLCKSINDAALIHCINCGIPLDALVTGQSTAEYIQNVIQRKARENENQNITLGNVPETGMGIYIHRFDEPDLITQKSEFTLGRKMESTDPDLIDFSPFEALELGVSRRHARIYQVGDGYRCMDLESTNGTWIENQRLVPKVAYSLSTRTQLRLGRLNLFLAYRKPSGEA